MLNRYTEAFVNVAFYNKVKEHGVHYCDVVLWRINNIVRFEVGQAFSSPYSVYYIHYWKTTKKISLKQMGCFHKIFIGAPNEFLTFPWF